VLVIDWDAPGTDTMSTHALMRGGVMQLATWGLLDRVIARGTPAVRRTRFDYGDEAVDLEIKASHGVEALYAPRRTVLDPILAAAAVEAGAEIRYDTALGDLLRDAAGRVNGATVVPRGGAPVPVRAGVVIGADGRRSSVARQVRAPVLRQSRHATTSIYAHATGLAGIDGYRWSYRGTLAAGLIPTNDDAICVFASLPRERYIGDYRRRPDAGLRELVAAVAPDLADVMPAARFLGRPVGFVGQKGYMRQASGPGWALVGDAAYFKDPLTAHGITDALRDAELLARHLDDGLAGRRDLRAALAAYARTRDELSLPVVRAADAMASFAWTLDELAGHHRDLSAALKAEAAFLHRLDGADALAAS
jgi:flavin-dependent dehydrogenase